MQSSYINLLSLSPCTKEIPYLGTGLRREDGQINHGFKNLIAYPELINAIPELATDRAMKSLVYSLNTGASRFFTTGCFSSAIDEQCGYRHHGYLEFSWNCQVCIRDAINYFSLFFHFEQFLHNHQFVGVAFSRNETLRERNENRKVKFQWSIQQTQFIDVNIAGFCCAIFIDTDYCTSSDRADDIWKGSLTILESFLNSVPGQSAQSIY